MSEQEYKFEAKCTTCDQRRDVRMIIDDGENHFHPDDIFCPNCGSYRFSFWLPVTREWSMIYGKNA